MKLTSACYECLSRLARQAAELATAGPALRQKALDQATRILDEEFSYNQLSIAIAAKIHKAIMEVTGNGDPYRAMKEKEMALARALCSLLSARASCTDLHRDQFHIYLELAAAANAIDFFRDPELIVEEMKQPVKFAIDDSGSFFTKLQVASKVLYLADNAGELYFDLPLVRWMKQFARVIYAVKPSAVQDDLTLEDVRRSGLEPMFGEVISTGVASPGIVFSLASDQFRKEFGSADLVFAKGMGHYEALSELPAQGRFFYCLKAKCQPVANSLGVPLGSYVAMLR